MCGCCRILTCALSISIIQDRLIVVNRMEDVDNQTRPRYKNRHGKRKCSSTTIEDKRGALLVWERHPEWGTTEAARHLGVNATTLLGWRRNRAKLFAEPNARRKRRCRGGGRRADTASAEQNIVLYVKDMHRTGKPPSRSAILAYCSWRFKSFKTKSYNAKHKWISRFIARNQLSDRVKQHSGSYLASDLQTVKREFSSKVRRFIEEGDYKPNDVWNMDQTGVIYDMKPKKVVVERGTKKVCDVNLESSQRSFRLTAFLTVSASGEKLSPLVVLQATPGGDIETRELPTLPSGAKYTVQSNGWTDEVVMLNYIRTVLAPLSQERKTRQLLIIDALGTHMTKSVRLKLQEINFEWLYVPAGATSVCQPLDVTIMALFKMHLRNESERIRHEREWVKKIEISKNVGDDDKGEDGNWLHSGIRSDDSDVEDIDELLGDLDTRSQLTEAPNSKEKRREVIDKIIVCWRRITPANVQNAFRSASIFPATTTSDSTTTDAQAQGLNDACLISQHTHQEKDDGCSVSVCRAVLSSLVQKIVTESNYAEWKSDMYNAVDKQQTKRKEQKQAAKEAEKKRVAKQAKSAHAAKSTAMACVMDRNMKAQDGSDIEPPKTPYRQAKKKPGDAVCSIEVETFTSEGSVTKLTVHQQDMDRLKPRAWLNDVIVSYYIKRYIPKYERTFIFDCQLFSHIFSSRQLHGLNYAAFLLYANITGTFRWESYQYVFIPVCMNSHWSFVIAINPFQDGELTPALVHVDSIPEYHNSDEVMSIVAEYLSNEKWKKAHRNLVRPWQYAKVHARPVQINGYDCGLYVLHNIEKISRALHEDPQMDLLAHVHDICTEVKKDVCNKLRGAIRNLLKSDSA